MLTTITLDIRGEKLPFVMPATPNMQLLVEGIFANKTYPHLSFLTGIVDLIMDIGGNIGAAALFLKHAYPAAKVFAYEPAGRTFDLLRQNVANVPGVTAIRAALFDRDGSAQMTFGGTGETSSLHPNMMTDGTVETVELRRAAIEFDRVAGEATCVVLKLDTEGSEVPILEDLRDRLGRVGAIYLEYHSDVDRARIDRLLVDRGFVLFSAQASHPHRGELCYVRGDLLDAHTTYARYLINRTE